jgi:hypothetical protein
MATLIIHTTSQKNFASMFLFLTSLWSKNVTQNVAMGTASMVNAIATMVGQKFRTQET